MPIPIQSAFAALAASAAFSGSNEPTVLPATKKIQATHAHKAEPIAPRFSIVADFRWNAYNDRKGERQDAQIKELEFGVAAEVERHFKAEAYVALANEDGETVVELEEAFGQFENLGRGFSAKIGKFAAGIGRVQSFHGEALNFLDFPFMVQDFLGEEGLRAGGASLSYHFPGDRFSDLTIEALDAPTESLFACADAGNPVWVGGYRTSFSLGHDASAQFGASYANGPNLEGRSGLWAAEFTYVSRPESGRNSLVVEAEGFWGKVGGTSETKFGGYAAATYQIAPRTFLTGKFDYSEIPGTANIRQGWTAGITQRLTDFHHFRAELQTITSNFESRRSALNVQFQWILGKHPSHKPSERHEHDH